ncbi:myb family transcription factor [Perilla frutescens var. frutescens]|nr:myb family transcription factor [Perilla frutescens var. frutescens]
MGEEGKDDCVKQNTEEKSKQKSKKDKKIKKSAMKTAESARISEKEVNATEVRKKRKKDEKKSKDDDFVGSKDTCNEAKPDEADLSSLQQEHVEDHNDLSAAQQEFVDNDTNSLLNANETQNGEAERTNKRKKKKPKISEKSSDHGRDSEAERDNKGKKRKASLVANSSDGTSPNKSNKKVRFSGQVDVFPVPSNSNIEKGYVEEEDMVRGKRFTREEDEIVKGAVMKYIEEHELGDEGLNMVLNCSKHPEVRGCWKEIGSSVPYRPYVAVYCRARVLFMRSENRKWTQEEYYMILKYQEENGNQWRALADELGKHTWHVKDTWRRIKLPNLKKGHWSQDEYQKLFDLVNNDLQLKVSEEKRSKHGMLRDNICWTAISDELSTRNQATCCLKWYKQLTSSMVVEGVWADTDDYRLLSALYSLDATCMEDVDWDDIIDNRSGDVCRKRWNQMVLHIGHHGNKSFAEQVEVLAERYCPHLLEARETWDSKPRVP